MCSICTNEIRRTNNHIWGHWRYRIFLNTIQTEDYAHLEMPKRCSEKRKAERGEQCCQTSVGLIWLTGWFEAEETCGGSPTDPFSLKTLYQLEWLKSNINAKKKKKVPLWRTVSKLEQLSSWGVTRGKCRRACAPASSSLCISTSLTV